MMRRRYDKAGILALYPQAFWDLFVEVEQPDVTTVGDSAVIEIRGPLDHHDDYWCDSYESILDRVTEACASEARNIILKIDSPGGELFGCFDAARTIRARCKAAGKRLVAYVEGCACSAAYALACSADEIVTSETAFCGSIGILITRVDISSRDAREGIGFALVASGKRKLDGNPHNSLSTPELESMQSQCNALAELFFELVASLRGVSADVVRALEADVFHGPRAVEVGLADRVASFDELLELLAKGPESMATTAETTETEEQPTPSSSQKDVDDARAALERAAADGDQKAQAALDVLNGGGDDDDEEPDEEAAAASRSSSSPAATGRTPRPRASTTTEVSADSAAGLANIVAEQGRRIAKMEREKETLERNALLASRPDLGKELSAHLATLPYKDAKAIVDRMPKASAPNKADRAAGTVVESTRGATEVDPALPAPVTSADAAAFDAAFGGGASSSNGVKREGTSLIFDAAGAARARLAKQSRTPAPVGNEGAAK